MPDEPTETSVPTPESIQADAAAAKADATSALQDEIKAMTESLKDASGTITDLDAQLKDRMETGPPAAKPVAAPTFDAKSLDGLADEQGIGQAILRPLAAAAGELVNRTDSQVAKLRREQAMSDPELGPLIKRYEAGGQLKRAIKKNRLGDDYFAQYGYGDIVGMIAFKDKSLKEEEQNRIATEAVARFKEEQAKETPADPKAPAPPVTNAPGSEGVHAGVVTAPEQQQVDEAAQIAAIEVSETDARIGELYYGINKETIQRQRHEMATITKELGADKDPAVLHRLGGMPIKAWNQLKDSHGNPIKTRQWR
jgi:hypothetical protein